jgi:Na+-transporting methylmalonyl-CoA/oxaloacetate decarboxylase gamma subunit
MRIEMRVVFCCLSAVVVLITVMGTVQQFVPPARQRPTPVQIAGALGAALVAAAASLTGSHRHFGGVPEIAIGVGAVIALTGFAVLRKHPVHGLRTASVGIAVVITAVLLPLLGVLS